MRAGDDTLRVQVALRESRVGRVRVDRATARLALGGSDVRLLNALVEGPLGRLRATGSYRDGVVESNFEADLPRVEPVLELVGRAPEPAGDARITGRVTGELAAPEVEAEVHFVSWRARNAQLWRGALGIWGRPLGPEPDLALELRAESLFFRGHTLRSVGADLDYRDGVLRVLRSQASAGDTLVAAALSVRSSPFDWNQRLGRCTRIDLETALVRVRESEFRVEDPAAIWWRNGAVHVDSLRLATRAGSLDLDGTFDSRLRTLEGRARLESLDLESIQQLLALPVRMTGSGSGWLEARGSLARTRVDGRIDLRAASFNGLPVDSLSLLLVGSDTATDIRELRLATPHGSVQGALWIGETLSLERLLDPARPRPSLDALSRAPISAVLQIESLHLARFWQARHRICRPRPGRSSASRSAARSSPTIEVRGWAEQIAPSRCHLGAGSTSPTPTRT
jgi:autotransporter translocation and assembly factor TamB